MIIVKAEMADLKQIIDITVEQRTYLKEAGIPQWQGAYPNEETYTNDINLNRLYVLKEDEEVMGFFALVYPDHNYDYIEDGKWLDDSPYIAVHRMGVANKHKGKGYSSFMFDWIKSQYNHVRVDTHLVNKVMNSSLKRNGFIYTGVVYMEDKTARNAYEWIRN